MSCKGKYSTHWYACDCRETFYREDSKRMIRAFQQVLRELKGRNGWIDLEIIREVCREGISPRTPK